MLVLVVIMRQFWSVRLQVVAVAKWEHDINVVKDEKEIEEIKTVKKFE